MSARETKNLLYEQVARIGKALSSPKRLELLELVAQGEKSVESLTAELAIDVKSVSAHLKALRDASLVQTRREGKYIYYRLSGPDVSGLCVSLRAVAREHLSEMQTAMQHLLKHPDGRSPISRTELLRKARSGAVIVIDVRPRAEFDAAHFPCARSMPLSELKQRLSELPVDCEIVAYCRGPFCVMSDSAVALLRAEGYRARKTPEGVSEWRAAGLALECANG
jgi:DNA-binding transcriptional ArsR family regulator/rhodanese-related sulfurtransferase